VLKQTAQDYHLAFTHLQNHQNISAYNLFVDLANEYKKTDSIKSAIFYILAGESRLRHGKDNTNESLEAGKLFLNFAKKEDDYKVKSAYLCASKCFLKAGNYNEAKKAFERAKKLTPPNTDVVRPVVIVDDSESIVIRLKNYLKKLGYDNTVSFSTGKDAIKESKKMFNASQSPIFLLDMGLPDVDGDVVASKILEEKIDSQIILITADEKTTKRSNKTISTGVTAFIQKPFTINDLKDALETAESEYSAL